MVAFLPIETAERTSLLIGGQGLGTFHLSAELQRSGIDIRFPFFNAVMELDGPLRIIGFTFLLILSPVVTSLWSLVPIFGNPSWYAFSVAAYAASWWICLPFWIRALYDAIRKRDTWWLTWAGVFIIWFVVAAYARFGAGYDAFRYRDAMVPVIMLLAAKGLEATLSKWRLGGAWPLMVKAYGITVALLILLRGLGIARLS